MLLHEDLSRIVIAAALEIHRYLGPGLLESAYEACLCHELDLRGVEFQRQVPLPVHYKGCRLDCGYRLDLVVGSLLVVEIKAVDRLQPIHEAQLLSYLRLGGYRIGLLINFHEKLLKDGIRRFAL
jgi:GxxExxY protein